MSELYIVLNGNVLMENNEDDQKVMLGQGRVFGTPDFFAKEWDFEKADANERAIMKRQAEARQRVEDQIEAKRKEEGGGSKKPPRVITALMEKGAVLRIRLADYKEHVLGIPPPRAPGGDYDDSSEPTDTEISGIPTELMTEADFDCVRVTRLAKRKLAATMYDFMAKNQLIPHNAEIMSSEFVMKGSMGREKLIEQGWVYVVIEGTIRLQIVKSGAKKQGTLACEREPGGQSLSIKTRTMPITLIESGITFLLRENCFTVGVENSKGSGNGGGESIGGGGSRVMQTSRSEGSLPQLPVRKSNPQGAGSKFKKLLIAAPSYRIALAFEKPTTYLAIPLRIFNEALREMPPDIEADITAQLDRANDAAYERILRLKDWLKNGHQTLPGDQLDEYAEEEEEVFVGERYEQLDVTQPNEESLRGSFESFDVKEIARAAKAREREQKLRERADRERKRDEEAAQAQAVEEQEQAPSDSVFLSQSQQDTLEEG